MKLKNTAWALMLGTATLLSACGGGDGGSGTLGVSGTAAIGAPIVGGDVTLKCAAGANVTAKTAADGTWSATVSGNALPCSVQVAGGTANGQALAAPLHSVAQDAGNTNITPLTDLIVAKLAGKDPAAWFGEIASNGDSKLSGAITADGLKAAVEVLKTVLASLPGQPSLPEGFDPLRSKFEAKAGDAADALLESYSQSLELAGLSSADAVAAVATGGTALTQSSSASATYTTPNLTSFQLALIKKLDGSMQLTLPDPNRGTKTAAVTGVDGEGNIAGLGAGDFSGFVSLLGNRVGMLCVAPAGSTGDTKVGQYLYVSGEMTEVTDLTELQGKTFTEYGDCAATGTAQFLSDGSFVFTENGQPSDAPDANIAQAFTAAGREEQEASGIAVQRAKAYKYTVNGATRYVYLMVSTKKGSATPEINAETDYVLFGVSN